ncbi:hypothetical protein AK812_SmicGene45584, partial [Symbiodinium microadriaticum]
MHWVPPMVFDFPRICVREDHTTKDVTNTICLTPPSAYEEDVRYRFAECVLDVKRNRLILACEKRGNYQ